MVWHPRLALTFQDRDIGFVRGVVWAAGRLHLHREHCGLLCSLKAL